MRIVRVSASNWRNFKQLDFRIEDRLFVVGPNAAGKSNLLDIFQFLGDIAGQGGGLAAALDLRGGLSKVRSLFARNHKKGRLIIEVELEDDGDVWVYRLSIRGQAGGKNLPIVDEEVVSKNGEVIRQRPDEHDDQDPALLTQTHLEQISANKPFRVLADYLSETQYFHLMPQLIREPARFSQGIGRSYGSDLIADMNAVKSKVTQAAWLKRIEMALQAAVPGFESLRLELDHAGVPHLVAGYRNWRETPSRQNETDFSDGTLRLLGLLWTLVSAPSNSGILLLEEPELSLNAAIVRTLPTVLANATAQRKQPLQVVLSTHSPDILDDEGVRASEILVLNVTEDGTVASLLSDIPSIQSRLRAELPKSEIVNSLIAPDDLRELVTLGRSLR